MFGLSENFFQIFFSFGQIKFDHRHQSGMIYDFDGRCGIEAFDLPAQGIVVYHHVHLQAIAIHRQSIHRFPYIMVAVGIVKTAIPQTVGARKRIGQDGVQGVQTADIGQCIGRILGLGRGLDQ